MAFEIKNGTLKKYIPEKGETEVVVPEGVTKIDDEAFRDCRKLTSIVIPEGVETIGTRAFYGCRSLQQITLPDSVTKIGAGAFYHCSGLTELVLPVGVTALWYETFSGCKGLRRLEGRGVTKLDDTAVESVRDDCVFLFPALHFVDYHSTRNRRRLLRGVLSDPDAYDDEIRTEWLKYYSQQRGRVMPIFLAEDLVNAVRLPAETGKINATNFLSEYLEPAQAANATQCVAYLLDWKNSHISPEAEEKALEKEFLRDPYAASEIKKLWEYTTNPEGGRTITGYKGTGPNVCIPPRIGKAPVTRIGKMAFCRCKSLASITIPDSVISIGDWAFSHCRSLANLTIPDSIISIGNTAFFGCAGLADNYGFIIVRNTLHGYEGKDREIVIPAGVTEIGDKAFSYCESLTSIVIPDSVAKIGMFAFEGCSSLSSINIPGGVTEISGYAFTDCENITIHAPAGSCAEQYAKKNNISFVAE